MATNSNGGLNRDYSQDSPLVSKAAMDAAYAAAPKGENGKKYKIVAGVLRNYGNPNYWDAIVDGTHAPINIESVDNDISTITINYPNLGASKNVSFVAVPDETLLQRGFIMGASVEVTKAVIQVGKARPISDFVYWSGSAWVANTSQYTAFSYVAGVLTCTHKDLYSAQCHDVSLVPRGGNYNYRVTANGGATTPTTIAVEIRDSAGVLLTVPDVNMKFFLTHGPTNTPDLNNLNETGGNIWVYGIFEV